jgi:hypothetical protein
MRSGCRGNLRIVIGLLFVLCVVGYPVYSGTSSPTPTYSLFATPTPTYGSWATSTPTPTPTIAATPTPQQTYCVATYDLTQYSEDKCDTEVQDLWEYCADAWYDEYEECLDDCPRIFGRSKCISRCKRVYASDKRACFTRQCNRANLDEHCREAYGEDAFYLCGGVVRGDTGD